MQVAGIPDLDVQSVFDVVVVEKDRGCRQGCREEVIAGYLKVPYQAWSPWSLRMMEHLVHESTRGSDYLESFLVHVFEHEPEEPANVCGVVLDICYVCELDDLRDESVSEPGDISEGFKRRLITKLFSVFVEETELIIVER